ncbi:mediator of RNA polymerase II transcription subunit 34-like, partial [Paramuricea clavata]
MAEATSVMDETLYFQAKSKIKSIFKLQNLIECQEKALKCLIMDLWSPSICLVISPLSSLMQDQVMYLNSVGIKAAFIGDDQTDEEIKWNVETGYYQLVYGSPEAFLASSRWRKMLTGDVYRDIVCLVAVDEAHCIQHWGYAVKKGEQAFRKWFSRINEMRSLLKKIPILALTATATLATKNKIVRALEMDTCEVINQSPNRKNIAYSVQAVTGGAHQTFGPIIKELREKTVSFERIIIYCQTIKICSHIYGVFKEEMGEDMYVSTGDITSGMVEMYHSRIDELNRDNIVKDFSIPNGHIRLLIATIAYGMGINCQGVKSIVHYGPSRNVEAYLQESGRAGRDSSDMCKAVILYSNVMLKYCDEPMTEYARN